MDNPFRIIMKVRDRYPRWIAKLLAGQVVRLSGYSNGSYFVEFTERDGATATSSGETILDNGEKVAILGMIDALYALYALSGLARSKYESTDFAKVYWINERGKILLLSDLAQYADQYDAIFAEYHAPQKTDRR